MLEVEQTQKPLLTAADLKAATGLTKGQVYRWTAEGRFPVEFIFKVGRRLYYRAAILAWLAGLDRVRPLGGKP